MISIRFICHANLTHEITQMLSKHQSHLWIPEPVMLHHWRMMCLVCLDNCPIAFDHLFNGECHRSVIAQHPPNYAWFVLSVATNCSKAGASKCLISSFWSSLAMIIVHWVDEFPIGLLGCYILDHKSCSCRESLDVWSSILVTFCMIFYPGHFICPHCCSLPLRIMRISCIKALMQSNQVPP